MLSACLKLVLLALLQLTAAASAFAVQPLQLHDGVASAAVWPHLRMLVEPDEGLDASQALARLDEFKVPPGYSENLGRQKSAIWLHATIESDPGSSQTWTLDIDYGSIGELEVFVLREGRLTQHARTGSDMPLADRPRAARTPSVVLELQPGARHELLMRVRSGAPLILPISLLSHEALHAREARTQLVQGVLAGIAACLLIYTIGHWLILREVMFLYYAMVLIGTSSFFFSYHGLGAQHLWGASQWYTQSASAISLLLSVAGGALFIERVFDAAEIAPLTSRAMLFLAAATGLVFASFALGLLDVATAFSFAMLSGPLLMALAVPIAYKRWRQGDPAGAYVVFGWTVYGLGIAAGVLMAYGQLPANRWTTSAFQAGSLVDIVCWMLALGVRTRQLQKSALDLRREREHLQTLAETDPVTGLLNRRGLHTRAEVFLARASATRKACVYVIDLDGFKAINDRLGHHAGDRLLAEIAARLRSMLRSSDLACRTGGDEFAIIVDGLANDTEAERVASKLLATCARPFLLDNTRCTVGMTIGYVSAPDQGTELSQLLRMADAALYSGKAAGKGRVVRWPTLASPPVNPAACADSPPEQMAEAA